MLVQGEVELTETRGCRDLHPVMELFKVNETASHRPPALLPLCVCVCESAWRSV